MTKREAENWQLGLGLGVAALLVVGGCAVLASGPSNESIGDKIDRLVLHLNSSRFRNGWGGVALFVLRRELQMFVPAYLMVFLDAVYDAESRHALAADKRYHAIAFHNQTVAA